MCLGATNLCTPGLSIAIWGQGDWLATGPGVADGSPVTRCRLPAGKADGAWALRIAGIGCWIAERWELYVNVGTESGASSWSWKQYRCTCKMFGVSYIDIHRLPVCTACCCCLQVRNDVSAEVRATVPAQAYLPLLDISAIFWSYS